MELLRQLDADVLLIVEVAARSWSFAPSELAGTLRRASVDERTIDEMVAAGLDRVRGAVEQARRSRSFVAARTFARGLGLASRDEWHEFACSGRRPPDIPANPARTYRHEGWCGWADFLRDRRGLAFAVARVVARELKLTGREDWIRLAAASALPEGLPRRPDVTYARQGWCGWADFLGTRWTFGEARAFARSLGLRSAAEWFVYTRGGRPDLPSRPAALRANPSKAYRSEGWRGWVDFLGTERNGS